MNVRSSDIRDSEGAVLRALRRSIRPCRLLCPVAVLCMALIASSAPAKGDTKPKPKPGKASCGGGETPAAWKPTAAPEEDKKRSGPPRWVCEEPSILVEPLWRGDQIGCAFIIRNEGGADLKIQAKGG